MSKLMIRKTNHAPLQTSLQSMLTEKKRAQQYTLLLCDTSGSMDEYARNECKIETLARTANRLAKEKRCKIIAFDSTAREVNELTHATGGNTNLTAALEIALTHKDAHQIIIISDGYPNEGHNPEVDAKRLVRALHCPVSCIYVGPGDDDGYRFLKELAQLGKGKSAYTGGDMKRIEKAARLMLPA